MIPLQDADGGVLLPVQAQPKARRNGIVGEHAGRMKVAVTAPPDKGKANEALVRVIAEAFGVRRADVSIVAGHTHPAKTFLIAGIDRAELARRVAGVLEAAQSEK